MRFFGPKYTWYFFLRIVFYYPSRLRARIHLPVKLFIVDFIDTTSYTK